MKISCILTSYNRPKFLRHALKSLADQTHRDFEVLLYDDSTLLDAREVVNEFNLPSVKVFKNDVTKEDRRKVNRLSVNCNSGLKEVSGELVCFLCDDDYYYPEWFARASTFFSEERNKDKKVAFGILSYSGKSEMVFDKAAPRRFFESVVKKPACMLDHNQVVHRRFDPPFKWPENWGSVGAPDAIYFKAIADAGNPFHPLGSLCVVKRNHTKNLQRTTHEIGQEKGEGLREP